MAEEFDPKIDIVDEAIITEDQALFDPSDMEKEVIGGIVNTIVSPLNLC